MWCSTSLTSREIFPCLQRVLAQGMDCRGHGNKLPFELENSVLFSAWGKGNRETHLELCSAVQFVVPDLLKGCVGGSTEGKEKGDKWEEQAAALHQRALVCSMMTGTSWGRHYSQATCLLSVLSCWEQDIELALSSPAWGQLGIEEAKPGHPFLNVSASTSLHCAGCWHAVPLGYPPVVASITLGRYWGWHPRGDRKMRAWKKTFMSLPTSHGTIAILRNQSLDPSKGLVSHLLPQW